MLDLKSITIASVPGTALSLPEFLLTLKRSRRLNNLLLEALANNRIAPRSTASPPDRSVRS